MRRDDLCMIAPVIRKWIATIASMRCTIMLISDANNGVMNDDNYINELHDKTAYARDLYHRIQHRDPEEFDELVEAECQKQYAIAQLML